MEITTVKSSQIYYINSTNQINSNDSNFSFIVQLSPQFNFNRVIYLAVSIPKSFYQIETEFATFHLKEGISTVNITLKIENYNRKTLASIFATNFTTNLPND
jgi:hypothetical protein